jgi:cell division protein FtsI/penicillin-binding protein 2
MELRRGIALYAILVAFFFLVVCRIYYIAHNNSYAKKAENQTVTNLTVETQRGNFYDCTGQKLTGRTTSYYALCIPGEKNYARLFSYVSYDAQAKLYKMRNAASPFLMEVGRDLTKDGVYTISRERRYGELAICTHLIGYLDSEGHGVSGLEAAFDEQLMGSGTNGYIQCVTNAQGALMDKTQPSYQTPADDGADVQLTIESGIQRACEGIAGEMMDKGCILVLDTATAEVRACVSLPDYDPSDVQASIAAGNTALVNRALSAYAVGSVFKPVLAAAALQEGQSGQEIDCVGYTKVSDHIYRCAGGIPHGRVDLADALAQSCNCYFIALGQALGPKTLYRYADAFGFGQPTYLAGGLKSAAGNLPDVSLLENLGEKSNFSFGQGALLATPVQVAAMMNAIAAGGEYKTPTFLERTFDADTGKTIKTLSHPETRRVMSEGNAILLQKMLAGVVTEGRGKEAQPMQGASAGKTGTAQTGRYNEEREEYKNLWFAGFYPAENPQYTIVVMQDDQTEAENSSAAVFARVCDALALMKYVSFAQKSAA